MISSKIQPFSTKRVLCESYHWLETVMCFSLTPGLLQSAASCFRWCRSNFRIRAPQTPVFRQRCSPAGTSGYLPPARSSHSDVKHMERKWWETRLDPWGVSGRDAGHNALGAHVGGLHTSHIWHGAVLCCAAVHKASITAAISVILETYKHAVESPRARVFSSGVGFPLVIFFSVSDS